MPNRVVVDIDGRDYTIIAEEDESYIRKTAALIDGNIAEIKKKNPQLDSLACAVLAGLNAADLYYKGLAASDGLRAQISSYAEENAALRAENSRLKKKLK